ncbi:uncharacterized protein B0I36DRAFT_376858 [Microdochium trichocladiopsis]|uniref:Uncharacterized protein n=1 Tax=Microdochium trichocladiopsis TaxID=1682393 RepID=A0A9P8XXT0_9PEZI|nr:uncharacterized protein B0I36DRAFT_376858 [Microdochium trichocladiopsis]KAH7025244.1 hypothetical protein B0I36DRAFT_376858 [Microdochium trichocladiopsis]
MASVTASPVLAAENGHHSDQVIARTLYQFENGTRIENIAVRKNGNLLVTLSDRPELYEIDPFNPAAPKLIHHFAGYSGLGGITETAPDHFTVNAGNITFEPFLWKLDFNNCGGRAKVSKVTDMPDALYLNGMTTLDSRAGTILTGDCASGRVFRIDTRTGDYTVALDDELLQPPPNAILPVGVNGIRLIGHYLYFMNTFKALYGRVPVDLVTGKAKGPYEVLAANIISDNLAVRSGVGYLAGSQGNVIYEVQSHGDRKVIAGNLNSTVAPSSTSAAFGRTRKDKNTLYVVTSGTEAAPVSGMYIEPGKVVALDVHSFNC